MFCAKTISARCTSAAPWYFKPKCLPGLGTFQDGGLRHNNPVNIALWESGVIWPETNLDILLSMGTGSSVTSKKPSRNGFIPRLVRSFLSSMDGEDTWQQLCNRLPREVKDKYFRFNVKFNGSEPAIALDSVDKMQELEQRGRTEINLGKKIDAAESLIAKQFYFELEALPIYRGGRYQCAGRIFCRFSGARQLALLTRLSQNSAHFLLGERPMTGVQLDGDTYCKIFQPKVEFSVEGLEEEVTIFLRSGSTKLISGFPTSIAFLIRCQGLDAAFGVSNHSKRKNLEGEVRLVC